MSAFHDNILLGASGQQGYQIGRSVRLRSSASAYLNRTFGTPTSGTIWTWSGWVKLGTLSVNRSLFSAFNGAGTAASITLNSSDQLQLESGGGAVATSTAVFRDPSAWYHIVCSVNGSNTTIYVNNNSRLTYSGGNLTAFNTNTVVHNIGRRLSASPDYYFDGYLTEVNFIDGQALTPSSFGETDSITGVWKPKKYAGTYGTNGFYLNFSDNSAATAAAIGKDSSGNGNNWTPNNISVTSGTTYDSMLDVPTPYADGGNGRGNYAVFNPVNVSGGGSTITDGNLACSAGSTTTYGKILGSIGMSTGKWYWEVTITAVGSLALVGVGDGTPPNGSTGLGGAAGELAYFSNGNKYTNAVSSAYGATYTTNNVIGVAYDADAGSITFYKDNVSQGAITGLSGTKYPAVGSGGGTNPQYAVNFGQRPFTYTPPTGYKALNTQNLPVTTITNGAQYMAATTYTGTGSSYSVTNGGNNTLGITFKPDFVWVKERSQIQDHALFDSVRGATKQLSSNTTGAEATYANSLSAFNSNGFTVVSDAVVNSSSQTYVAWQWQAGQGTTSSNTSGSITSTVSVNTTAGFSVVTYTGTGANATVGHGLGVAPKMIIVKNRGPLTWDWIVYHGSLGATQYMILDTTAAAASSALAWNNTEPTSSVFSLGTGASVNRSGDSHVAYLFAEVAGFSKFGSYTGNGSADGPFVYCGFRPRWLMIKRTDTAGFDWFIWDSSRSTYNAVSLFLNPDTSGAEGSGSGLNFVSNGFKWYNDTGTSVNASGATYIYAAFAENPFRYSLAR